MILVTVSQVVEVHNSLNSMSTEELWTLADKLEIEVYAPDRDDVLSAIVDTLQSITWSINQKDTGNGQ